LNAEGAKVSHRAQKNSQRRKREKEILENGEMSFYFLTSNRNIFGIFLYFLFCALRVTFAPSAFKISPPPPQTKN
jgi:hypothetical protein